MRIHRVIRRVVQHHGEHLDVSADVNAVVAAAIGEPGASVVSVHSESPIVQSARRSQRRRRGTAGTPITEEGHD